VSLRGVRSSLAAALVLSGAVSFAVLSTPSGASGANSPTLTLLDQSAYVMPALAGGPARFHIEVGVASSVPSDAQLAVTVYKPLQSRSSFEETLTNPPQDVLQSLGATALSSLPASSVGGRTLNMAVVPQPSSASGVESPTIDLHCDSLSDGCSGVYPVQVALERPGAGVLAHFTTYLTYAQGNDDALLFAWVLPFAAPVRLHTTSGPLAQAILPPTTATLSNLAQVANLLHQYAQVPVTVAAAPQTLQLLSGSAIGRQTVATLSELSLTESAHEFLPEPYVPINLNAFSASGLTGEISAQMAAGAGATPLALKTEPPVGQGGSTWIASGAVGTALGNGLRLAGASRVVVPDTDLSSSDSDRATWSQPFDLPLAKGQTVLAATSDGELATHFSANPSDPVLAANQLLADLAVIHLVEKPFPADPRGVIAVPPRGWVANPIFVAALLKGLNGNPVVQATTLDDFFARVPKGGNDFATTRHLSADGPGPSLSRAQAAAIAHARSRASAFASSVPRQTSARAQINELLLASESDDLSTASQHDAFGDFERQLSGQLSLVQVASRTITITARNASIPITITSSAPYSVHGILSLTSGKLEFPRGHTQAVSIDHPTNTTRVDVLARTSGDLPLELTFTSPNGVLVIARGRLTVRSTATSVVGIALTALAVLVLAAWWARTWRRSRREKRGRPTRGLAAHAGP
jgi:Family of unknown function (DUF6049)